MICTDLFIYLAGMHECAVMTNSARVLNAMSQTDQMEPYKLTQLCKCFCACELATAPAIIDRPTPSARKRLNRRLPMLSLEQSTLRPYWGPAMIMLTLKWTGQTDQTEHLYADCPPHETSILGSILLQELLSSLRSPLIPSSYRDSPLHRLSRLRELDSVLLICLLWHNCWFVVKFFHILWAKNSGAVLKKSGCAPWSPLWIFFGSFWKIFAHFGLFRFIFANCFAQFRSLAP